MYAVALAPRTTRRRPWTSAERDMRRLAAPEATDAATARLPRRHDVSTRTVEGFPCWTVAADDPDRRRRLPARRCLPGGHLAAALDADRPAGGRRLRVEVPLYGLAPQHTYRDAYPFVHAVYRELAQEAPPGGVVLLGDSAGGGLALGLAQDLLAGGERRPDRLVLLSPWLDLTLGHPRIPEYERYDPWLARAGLVEAGLAWAGGDDPTAAAAEPGQRPARGSAADLGVHRHPRDRLSGRGGLRRGGGRRGGRGRSHRGRRGGARLSARAHARGR